MPVLQVSDILARVLRQLSAAVDETEGRQPVLAAVAALEEAQIEAAWLAEYEEDPHRFKVRLWSRGKCWWAIICRRIVSPPTPTPTTHLSSFTYLKLASGPKMEVMVASSLPCWRVRISEYEEDPNNH